MGEGKFANCNLAQVSDIVVLNEDLTCVGP